MNRTLLALSAQLNWEIRQFDVTGAFLNGDLEETILMEPPQGLTVPRNTVCQLVKTLYGLKQSSREWNKKLTGVLQEFEMKKSTQDPCLFYKKSREKILFLTVYVDDILIFSESIDEIQKLHDHLTQSFELTSQGSPEWILGINIKRDKENGTITINQEKHVQALLDEFNMSNCNPVSTPMNPGIQFNSTKPCESPSRYKSLVGSLIYLSTVSRPDISSAVSILSRSLDTPTEEHQKAAKHLLRYLKGTQNLGIQFRRSPELNLECYADASFGSDSVDRKSTSGFLILLNGSPVSWASKKQQTVSLSTMEAEYIAMSLAIQEVIWIKGLFSELQIPFTSPVTLHEDNQGAIALSKDPKYHARSKHIDIKHHFIREQIQNNIVNVIHCESSKMLADIMTKPLPKDKFTHFVNQMHLLS